MSGKNLDGWIIPAKAVKALSYHLYPDLRENTLSRPGAKPAKSPTNSPKGNNQLRIIGGSWRGRKLSFPDVPGLRPTGDRVRETLFNWLAPDIQGARCLDLFAGSGALGLEALSRGAGFCLLLENHPLVVDSLRTSLALLKSPDGQVEHRDTLGWLQQGNQNAPFDLVFIDPPFGLGLWQAAASYLEQGRWLAEDALIYVEAPKGLTLLLPGNWMLYKDKHAGQVTYRLYRRSLSITG